MSPKQSRDFGEIVRAVQAIILKMNEMIERVGELEERLEEARAHLPLGVHMATGKVDTATGGIVTQ